MNTYFNKEVAIETNFFTAQASEYNCHISVKSLNRQKIIDFKINYTVFSHQILLSGF